MILREAEKDVDIVIWDGGNNDVPFFSLIFTFASSIRCEPPMRTLLSRRNKKTAWRTWS